MALKPSKTALLIAAIATAITVTSLTQASAKEHWVSADATVAEVVPADFKVTVKKHPRARFHHSHRSHRGFYHQPRRSHKFHAPHRSHGKHFSHGERRKRLIIKKLF